MAQTLNLPQRAPDAPSGSSFVTSIKALGKAEREDRVFEQLSSGNVPDFLRRLVPVTVQSDDSAFTLTYFVTPDYLSIGPDTDYCLMPMTPMLAQRIADAAGCMLPTRKMVDDIYRAARLKLIPQPIPPGPAMVTAEVFAAHNDSVWHQRSAVLADFPLGTLVAGDKKDIILSNSIANNLKAGVPRPVVIYGWHRPDGTPIQPVYNGHGEGYADYSHGVRLVQRRMILNGRSVNMDSLLLDESRCGLLSDEGAIHTLRYSRGDSVWTK